MLQARLVPGACQAGGRTALQMSRRYFKAQGFLPSLLVTCRMYNFEPYDYLADVLQSGGWQLNLRGDF